MHAIQPSPEVLIGLFSELPNPASVPQGYFYFATDSIQLFMLEINPVTQARAWVLTSSAGSLPGIPFDQVAVGNATGTGLTSSANFTYDPASGLLTARDTTGKILFTLDGNPATRLLSLFNAAGVSVFSYSTVTNAFAHAVPANPQYFVSNAGLDTNPGTNALPLATPQEAMRRLAISGWSGQPIVTLKDSINLGTNPSSIVFPAPFSGSQVLIQGATVDSGLGAVAPTGGTAGTFFPAYAGATVTSAAATVVNAYRGMFMRFTAGPLAGQRRCIVSNDGAGGFVLAGTLSVAPAAADVFVVERSVGKFTYTGTLRIDGQAGGWIDLVEFDLDAFLAHSGILNITACKFVGNPAVSALASQIAPNGSASWNGGTSDAAPAAVLPCGNFYDGSNGESLLIGSATGFEAGQPGYVDTQSVFFHADYFTSGGTQLIIEIVKSAMDFCGVALGGARHSIQFFSCSITNARLNPNYGNLAPIEITGGGFLLFSVVSTASSHAGPAIVIMDGSDATAFNWSGANPGAGIVPLVARRGAVVRLFSQPTVTGAGGAGVAEVTVGNNASSTWALVFGGLTANSTDIGAAKSELCRVGP